MGDDDAFRRLRRFESSELVGDYFQTVHARTANATTRASVVASVRQFRQLAESARGLDPVSKPIAQFYAIAAASRALALALRSGSSEGALTPGHGLSVTEWGHGGDPALIEVTTSRGLLMDLQAALSFGVWRTHSSTPDWASRLVPVDVGVTLRFVDVARLLAITTDEFASWTGEEPTPRIELHTITAGPAETTWVFHGQSEPDVLGDWFGDPTARVHPGVVYTDLAVGEHSPQFSQAYLGFEIGSTLLRPPLACGARLPDPVTIYIVAYVFSMLARYRPSTWMRVWSGTGGDRVLPFASAFANLVDVWYPRIIADYLEYIQTKTAG